MNNVHQNKAVARPGAARSGRAPSTGLPENPFGLFARPSCPKCGEDMVLRIPWSANPGHAFWGCRRYPRCTGTRSGS
jgi:hypothetical protein